MKRSNTLLVCTSLVLALLFFATTPEGNGSTRLSGPQIQVILDESIRALLTGKEFGAPLEKRQLQLRKIFEEGRISKKKLTEMVESSIMAMLDEVEGETSADTFRELPSRVEALLSPYMTWQEVKDAGFRIATPFINESIEDLLTGRPFSADLVKKQLLVRKMFEAGLISKPECVKMVEDAMLPILNRVKTSRYILKDMPKRVEALLSPYMAWEEVEEAAWRMGSSLIRDGDYIELTIGTLAPPGTPWLNIPEKVLIPRVAKLSDNKVRIKIFPSGVMGEDTDILRKMDIGQLSGCGCTALGILAASPETSVLMLPGLFESYGEVDHITSIFRKRIDQSFEERGYILGALVDTGFFYLFSQNPVSSLADLKKQKLSTWFGDVEMALYRELGLDATPVAVPETISAMSSGLTNVNMAPPAWMLGMQAYQYVNYFFAQPILYSPGAIVVSVQTKEKLRKKFGVSETLAYNVQEMLVYEVSKLEPMWKKEIRSYEAKCLEAFQARCGMKAVSLSKSDKEALKRASLNVYEKLAGKAYPRDMLADIQRELEKYRAGQRGPSKR